MTIHVCLWKAKIWWRCDRIVVIILLQWQLWGLMQCSHWVHQKGILIEREGEGSINRVWKEKDTEITRYKEGGRDRERERVKKSHLMCDPAPGSCGDGLSEEVYHWNMWLNVSMRCAYGVSVSQVTMPDCWSVWMVIRQIICDWNLRFKFRLF